MKKIIIYSTSYYDDNGGSIVLNRLCHLLNLAGEKAFIWPSGKPVWNNSQQLKSIIRFFRWFFIYKPEFKVSENFITPIAEYSDLKNSIIVYPEIVNGNPLLAKHVVRWFLHKPGFHTGMVNYGKNELYFYFQLAFNDASLNPDAGNILQVLHIRDDIYYQTNFGERKGTCYIVRKGKDRTLVHDIKGSILIDNLTHHETAKVFNSVEMCISYDLYTLYSEYAAMCGCISIVIPEDGLSKTDWCKNEAGRNGVAYGFEDIQYAINTQEKVLPMLKEQEDTAHLTVKEFTLKCAVFLKTNNSCRL